MPVLCSNCWGWVGVTRTLEWFHSPHANKVNNTKVEIGGRHKSERIVSHADVTHDYMRSTNEVLKQRHGLLYEFI